MTKKELNTFEKARTVLIEATKKAFLDYCVRNGMKSSSHNVEIKYLWLINYEMVEHPTCTFTGGIIVTSEKLMSLINDLGEFERRIFKIAPHITIKGERLYEVEIMFCFDYVTEEVTFAPNW